MDLTKKRKLDGEEEATGATLTEVQSMILLWDQDQLRKVLAKLGSESSAALEAIKEENRADPKMRKIFVRNLPYTTNDASLRTVFEQHGVVEEAVVIMDKAKGQSKGFGFVTYQNVEDAEKCLETPTKEIDGRQAFVNLAAKKDSAATPALGGVGTAVTASGLQKTGEDIDLRKLFVRSLSYETTSAELNEFFSQFGEVSEAVVLTNRDTGTSKGYGFVTMATSAAAAEALLEPTKQLAGRTCHVKLAATNDGNRPSNAAPAPSYGQQYGGYMGGMMQQQYGAPAYGGYPPYQQDAGQYGMQQQW
jgi:heterogeneous nuclear ribonucleoprotein A1/A3